MTTIVAEWKFDEIHFKDIHCDDVHVGVGKTIQGENSLNITCQGGSINLGNGSDTININGTVNNVLTENLNVKDKLIQINHEAVGEGTCRDSGFNFRDNDVDNEGYLKTSSNGQTFKIKAPENDYILTTPVLTENATLLTSEDDVLTSNSTVERSNISTGTANYIVANDSNGLLSEEEFVSEAEGGLGVDVSEIANSKFLEKDSNGDIVGVDTPSMTIADYSVSLTKLVDTTDNNYYGSFLEMNVDVNGDNKHEVKLTNDIRYDGSNIELNKPLFLRDEFIFGTLNHSGYPAEEIKKFNYTYCEPGDSGAYKSTNCAFYFENEGMAKFSYKTFAISEDKQIFYDEAWFIIKYSPSENSGIVELLTDEYLERKTFRSDSSMDNVNVNFDFNGTPGMCRMEARGIANKTVQFQTHYEVFIVKYAV